MYDFYLDVNCNLLLQEKNTVSSGNLILDKKCKENFDLVSPEMKNEEFKTDKKNNW